MEHLRSFSALQRAENSSISNFDRAAHSRALSFSALQRAENSSIVFGDGDAVDVESFSALQRAENSSISALRKREDVRTVFQCSSASRKFLNSFG